MALFRFRSKGKRESDWLLMESHVNSCSYCRIRVRIFISVRICICVRIYIRIPIYIRNSFHNRILFNFDVKYLYSYEFMSVFVHCNLRIKRDNFFTRNYWSFQMLSRNILRPNSGSSSVRILYYSLCVMYCVMLHRITMSFLLLNSIYKTKLFNNKSDNMCAFVIIHAAS